MPLQARRSLLRLAMERVPPVDHPSSRQQDRVWLSRIPTSSSARSAGLPVADQRVEGVMLDTQKSPTVPGTSGFVIEKPCGLH